MFVKLRTKHPFLFSIVVYLIFVVFMNLGAGIFYVVDKVLSLDEGMTDALSTIAGELVAALVLCIILHKTGKFYLLSKKGKGFLAGLIVGGYSLAFIAFVFISGAVGNPNTEGLAYNFTAISVVCIISMFTVGITEEITARALIGETILEHFGTTHKSIIQAALISGLIFGGMHFTNIFVTPVEYALYQMVLCFTGGTLYTAIYYRSGNLWSIIFIHGLNDFAASISTWLYNGGVEIATQSSSITTRDIIYIVVFGVAELAVAFFLLRKSKVQEVQSSWSEIATSTDSTTTDKVN